MGPLIGGDEDFIEVCDICKQSKNEDNLCPICMLP